MAFRRKKKTRSHTRLWDEALWEDAVNGPFGPVEFNRLSYPIFPKRWWRRMKNIFKATPVWPTHEAFYAILLAAAWADNELQDEEEREMKALLGRTPTLTAIPEDQKEALHKKILKALDSDFQDTVEIACASLPAEMRVSAFSHAVDIVYADRAILPLEAKFLNKLVELLEIDDTQAISIAEAMKLKNEY